MVTWGNAEYPLYTQENADQCPTARYVGGVSRWLCECRLPRVCKGVIASNAMIKAQEAQAKREVK